MSAWVLSIAGVCLLSVVVDLFLPEGKTNSSIKNVFSYVIVLVVLMPVGSLLKNGFSFDDVFSMVEFETQDEYIYNTNQAKLDKWTLDINNELTEHEIYGVTVTISANIFETDMQINAVYVDLYNAVINAEKPNINIQTEVVEIVVDILNIDKEKIVFYE
ncbi:MAG: hypothetical protein E7378_00105 [Clostridiales bacterium]|nr:hypothetical protein [Clostridiales bacterium]